MSSIRSQLWIALAAGAALALAACQQAPATGGAPKEAAAPKEQVAAPKAATEAPKAAPPKEQVAAKPADGAPIKIGFVGPRTGTLAQYGESGARGVEFFVEDLNAQGGVLGRKLEVIYRDSKGAQDEAVRVTRELLLSERVDFLVHTTNSGECLGMSEVAREARKLLFSSCAIDDFLTTRGHRYVFRVPNITTRTQGQSAVKYALEHVKNFKTIAILAHDYAFGRGVAEQFKTKMRAVRPDVQWVSEAFPKLTETDYSPYITALQSQKPDITLYSLGVAVPFFNQAVPVNLHKQTQLLSSYWGGVDDLATLTRPEAVPEGMVAGGYPWYLLDSPAIKQLVEKFRARTNQYPRASFFFEHMTMQFLTEAVKKAGTTDTEKVIDALEGLETSTVIGKVRIRPFDHQGATPYWVGRAKWDPNLKLGVLSEIVNLGSEEFLPTEAEIKQMRGQ